PIAPDQPVFAHGGQAANIIELFVLNPAQANKGTEQQAAKRRQHSTPVGALDGGGLRRNASGHKCGYWAKRGAASFAGLFDMNGFDLPDTTVVVGVGF